MSNKEHIHEQNIPSKRKRFSAKDYIQKFKLERHQEGGYFAVNYTSTDKVMPLDARYRQTIDEDIHRLAGSAIYFLLELSNSGIKSKISSFLMSTKRLQHQCMILAPMDRR